MTKMAECSSKSAMLFKIVNYNVNLVMLSLFFSCDELKLMLAYNLKNKV